MPCCWASGVSPTVGSLASTVRSLVTSHVLLLQLAVSAMKAKLAIKYFFMFNIVLLLGFVTIPMLHTHYIYKEWVSLFIISRRRKTTHPRRKC